LQPDILSGCFFYYIYSEKILLIPSKPSKNKIFVLRIINEIELFMVELYRDSGLEIYEKAHYSHGEHVHEVEQIVKWYTHKNTRVLDIGCNGGLHALEFAKKGFSVTGVDIEPSAIGVAKKRSRNQTLGGEFRVIDIERDDLSSLGKFDLIYSIGNVMSHVRKDLIVEAFRKIRECLDKRGIFLFDILIIGEPFKEEVRETDLNIVWKRRLDNKTGKISMEGIFLDFGITQHFEVWGYTVEEVIQQLHTSGFRDVEFSDSLDFSTLGTKTKNPVCLRFRSRSQNVC